MSVAACLVTELNNVTTEDEADWEKSEFVRRFSFDDFKDDVKRQCPCIFDLLLALMLPPIRYSSKKSRKSEEYREVETAATAIISILLKCRRKRVGAFPLLISLTLLSRGTNKKVGLVSHLSDLHRLGPGDEQTECNRNFYILHAGFALS